MKQRAHCVVRKQIKVVLGIERGHGAAFESFVKTVAAQLLRRCSEAEVEAAGSGHACQTGAHQRQWKLLRRFLPLLRLR